jgi:hypothetical protein
MAKVCCGIVPDVAAGVTALKSNSTPAFPPVTAGPWMWAMLALLVRPEKVRLTVICVSAVFSTTVPTPVPELATAGTCWAPVRIAWNLRSAWTGKAHVIKRRAQLTTAGADFMTHLLPCGACG